MYLDNAFLNKRPRPRVPGPFDSETRSEGQSIANQAACK